MVCKCGSPWTTLGCVLTSIVFIRTMQKSPFVSSSVWSTFHMSYAQMFLRNQNATTHRLFPKIERISGMQNERALWRNAEVLRLMIFLKQGLLLGKMSTGVASKLLFGCDVKRSSQGCRIVHVWLLFWLSVTALCLHHAFVLAELVLMSCCVPTHKCTIMMAKAV